MPFIIFSIIILFVVFFCPPGRFFLPKFALASRNPTPERQNRGGGSREKDCKLADSPPRPVVNWLKINCRNGLNWPTPGHTGLAKDTITSVGEESSTCTWLEQLPGKRDKQVKINYCNWNRGKRTAKLHPWQQAHQGASCNLCLKESLVNYHLLVVSCSGSCGVRPPPKGGGIHSRWWTATTTFCALKNNLFKNMHWTSQRLLCNGRGANIRKKNPFCKSIQRSVSISFSPFIPFLKGFFTFQVFLPWHHNMVLIRNVLE